MSERPNDLAEGQPDDSAALSDPVPDDAPKEIAVTEAAPEVEAAVVPEPEPEADPVVASVPEVEVETAPEPDVEPEFEAEIEAEAGAEPEFGDEAFEPGMENVEPDMVAAPVRPMTPAERRAARSGLAHGQLPIDPALRIKDRASAIFVLVTVGVFAVIFLNAMILGHGGLLAPLPTATPVPSLTAAPSATPAPSITAAPSATPAPSDTPAPSASPAPS